MSNVGKTLVRGHGLLKEGHGYVQRGCEVPACVSGNAKNWNEGHASCACGAYSPHLFSTYARKAWHRQHKAEIRAAQ